MLIQYRTLVSMSIFVDDWSWNCIDVADTFSIGLHFLPQIVQVYFLLAILYPFKNLGCCLLKFTLAFIRTLQSGMD